MESGRLRFLDIRNPYPHLDSDPRRNLPTSSRVPVRRVVVQSGPSRVGTQSGDNYSAGRYPDVPPSEGEREGRVLDGSAVSPRFLSAGTVAAASTCGTRRIN